MMSKESTEWFMSEKGADEWHQTLLNDYDYVALYLLDEYFINTYSKLFADPSEISNNTVYVVNKETGLLELCK